MIGKTTDVIVVSGAASGIGRAVALHLAKNPVQLVLMDTDAESLVAVEAEIQALGGADAFSSIVDVSDGAAVQHAMQYAAQLGKVRGLVSAAGILTPGTLENTTSEEWEKHFDVNTRGVFNLLQQGTKIMEDGASVVVISSNAARVPRIGMLAYAASKAAASALTKCAGLELAARGIRCNAVEPGSTDSPMLRKLWDDEEQMLCSSIKGAPDKYRIGIPLGRIGSPDDVAELVGFLLSDKARHITMQQIFVDGGASL